MSTSISTNRMMKRVRVELFFKDKSELRERVRFLHENGVRAFNLVNKDKKDALADWVSSGAQLRKRAVYKQQIEQCTNNETSGGQTTKPAERK
jgi:hypothetical protein